jgi:hypothetical protein
MCEIHKVLCSLCCEEFPLSRLTFLCGDANKPDHVLAVSLHDYPGPCRRGACWAEKKVEGYWRVEGFGKSFPELGD